MSDQQHPRRGLWSWLLSNVWVRTATRPPVYLSLGFLTLGGFVAPNVRAWADVHFGNTAASLYVLAFSALVSAGLSMTFAN